MTMRQVFGLLEVIGKAHLVEFYHQILSYGMVHSAKLPSLEEFLNLSLDQSANEPKSFDDTTDKALEAHARKRLEEMAKTKHGK